MDITASRREAAPRRARENSPIQLGEQLISCLETLGVEFIFGVPGGAIEPIYNAIARSQRRNGLRAICARSETGAAYMAQGYYRETGKPGVCMATTGPGATSLLSGVASAYLDEVPLLVITGMNSPTTNARAAFQDSSPGGVDTFSLLQTCTRYSALITQTEQFERELYTALTLAFSEQPGPVHLCIPVDVSSADCTPTDSTFTHWKPERYSSPVDNNGLPGLLTCLRQKHRLALVIGEGCRHAASTLVSFAEHLQIYFVTLPGAKGYVDPEHPLYRGVFGFAGHFSAREALVDPELDYVIVAGAALSEWDTAKWDKEAIFNSRLIHIDPVIQHLSYTPMAKLHIRSDVKYAIQYLLAHLPPAPGPAPTRPAEFVALTPARVDAETNGIQPVEVMKYLGKNAPEGTRFIIDAGNCMSWGLHYLHPEKLDSRQNLDWFRISMRFAAMGWGIGNAVGAAIGNRETPVICIIGDGSLLMNGQEFTVALAEALPVTFIVLNDSSLGMVKHGQALAGAESISNALPRVNFADYALALGGNGIRCETTEDLFAIDLEALVTNEYPALIDVVINGNAVPPMHKQALTREGMSYV